MRITAILSIRNEEAYIANCLRHLIQNGLNYIIIDNQSDDRTRDIIQRPEFADHLVELITHPYPGYFDWTGLMKAREEAANACEADWVLFVSADEIMHSYVQDELLSDSIRRVAATGADVIDFNEFVFLPIERNYQADIEGHQALSCYYFFEPTSPRLMRARKRTISVSHLKTGGHTLEGTDFKLANESFALRHYIFRDQQHAFQKYQERTFSKDELAKGWHQNRHQLGRNQFRLPTKEMLKSLSEPSDHNLDKTAPYKTHFWQWNQPVMS